MVLRRVARTTPNKSSNSILAYIFLLRRVVFCLLHSLGGHLCGRSIAVRASEPPCFMSLLVCICIARLYEFDELAAWVGLR